MCHGFTFIPLGSSGAEERGLVVCDCGWWDTVVAHQDPREFSWFNTAEITAAMKYQRHVGRPG